MVKVWSIASICDNFFMPCEGVGHFFVCGGDWGTQGPESCVPMIKGAFAAITCFSHK